MSDTQATFSLNLDSSGLRSGIDSGLSAYDKMRLKIQSVTKVLQGHKTAMDNLRKMQSVARFDALTKVGGGIEKATKDVDKLGAKFKELQDTQEIAKQVKVDPAELAKLEQEIAKVGTAYDEAKAKAAALNEEAKKLYSDNEAVKAFSDHSKGAKAAEAELSELQTAYSRAGGDASKLGDKIEEPTSGIKKLMEQAKGAGGPLGTLASQIEGVATMTKSAGPLALLAVIVAIGVAAVTAAGRLAKMALVSADAARNAARARSTGAMGSVAGTKEIEGAMAALRANTALAKGEAQALAIELKRGGEASAHLEQTAVTIGRFAQHSEEAQSAVKSLYDELRKPTPAIGGLQNNSMIITKDQLPRDVFLELATQLGKDGQRALVQGFSANKTQIRQALARIGEQKFAGPALEQMRSLDKLSERLQENLQSLFEKLKVGVLLGVLQKLVGLLDESSESGKAIREVLGAFTQPFADAVEAALPYVEALFEGIIFGALLVALIMLKVKNALAGLIPSSLTKNIDWLQVAFYAAIGITLALAAAFTLLALAALVLALPFITIAVIIIAIVVAIAMMVDAIVGEFDKLDKAIEEASFADIGSAIIDGIIGGLKDGAARLYAAFKELATGGHDSFKDAIKSKSPSWLFRLAGRTIPQGTALGIEDESPKVENAAAAMVGPDAIEGAGGGRSGNGKGVGVTLIMQAGAVVIQGVQDAADLTDEVIARIFRRALAIAAAEGGTTVEAPT